MKGWDGPHSGVPRTGRRIKLERNPVKQNTFLICYAASPKDFELKVEYRLSSTNSGIQIRVCNCRQGPTSANG